MFPGFSEEAIKFLRGLKKNNRREWFQPRKDTYERELQEPLRQLVEAVNERLARFAPGHMTEPKRAIFRIYRDTRFSSDKTPYKTHVAAWFRLPGLADTSGGGFYFHISADEVYAAGGVYMPPAPQLRAIRTHLLDHHARFRKLAASRKLKQLMGPMELAALARDPKGFPKDHPASDLIRMKQWGWGKSLPVDVALTRTLSQEITRRFEAVAPLVHLLNEPLSAPKPKGEIYFE